MGTTNYLRSPSGRFIHKSNSDDETKRHIFPGRETSRSSSSSAASIRRTKFLVRRPPCTAIPDIRREDCLTEGSYLIQRKSGNDKDSDQSYYNQDGAHQRKMNFEELSSPCTADHTFLITRYTGPRTQRPVAALRRNVSTVSTSTEEMYSSTGTVDGETGSGVSAHGFKFFEMSLKLNEHDNKSACTNSFSFSRKDATTGTDIQENMYSSAGTQSSFHLIGVGDQSKCLDEKNNSKDAHEKLETTVENTPNTTENQGILQNEDFSVGSILRLFEDQEIQKKNGCCSERFPEGLSLKYSKIIEISRKPTELLQDSPKEHSVGAIPKTPENRKKSPSKKELKSAESIPKTPEYRKKSSSKERLKSAESIPKTPEYRKKSSSKERLKSAESIPKTPEYRKRSPCKEQLKSAESIPKTPEYRKKSPCKEQLKVIECIPKTPETHKKGASKSRSTSRERSIKSSINKEVPKKANAIEKCIRKCSEHKGLNKGKSKKSRESVLSHQKKKGTSRRASSVECIPKSQENKEFVKSEQINEGTDEQVGSIMKNNWLGDEDLVPEPKRGILQTERKRVKSTVRFLDKEVSAQVDKEEKSSLTDEHGPSVIYMKPKIASLNKGTQWQGLNTRRREANGCRKFLRKCLTCQCCS
ncbi:unnamed protein product [Nezara viridula]|uniref:Uncharacterized protein n=1 Tax=Nezara viridula TaxID=85310 RepID=A0A9P0H3I5_NEZVI|nr:unnamed protein product [Nezara viridula]